MPSPTAPVASMLDNVAVSLQFVGAAFAGKDAVAVITESTVKPAADTKAEPAKEATPPGGAK